MEQFLSIKREFAELLAGADPDSGSFDRIIIRANIK